MPSRLRHPIVTFALLVAACKPIVPDDDDTVDLDRPDSVSDLLEAWWLDWATDTPERLGELAAIAAELVDEEALLDGEIRGEQRRFTQEHLDVVDLYAPEDDDGSWAPPDPALARPVYLINRFTCGIDALERVLYHLDQNALYEQYDTYERTYTSDFDAYTARTTDRIDWTATLTAGNIATGAYEETLLGGMRRIAVPERAEGDWADTDYLITRTWLPYPAKGNEGLEFNQDYQLEIYLPWGDDEIVHLYGIWRELRSGLLTFEDFTVMSITMTNLLAWDDTTERLCAEGRP